jgi:hypothetical protein
MAAPPASRADAPYKTFGWQGVTLTVPRQWRLVFMRGDRASGQVRLADEEAVRLEVRWQPAAEGRAPAESVGAYLERLRRRARKEGAELTVQRDLKLASPPGMQVECYRWTADRQALAMLSRCEQCGRLVHLHLWGGPQEQLKGLARTVFASLGEHPDGDTDLWRFLDVEFRAPARLPLKASSLQTGCVRMAFGRRSERLEFVRVSLAETLLRGKGLEGWFRGFYGPSLKRRSFGVEPAEWHGHPGLDVRGRAWLALNPLALIGRRRLLRAACWHCEPTNRLFICRREGRTRDEEAFRRAVEGFNCCPTD